MKKLAVKIIRGFGCGLRNGLVALGALALTGSAIAIADYNATVPGSGTSFASKVISTVHHAAMLICDTTLGEAQCAAVNSAGSLQIDETTGSQFHTDLTASIPAGSNIVGKIGIDQTTPGTTNGVDPAAAANWGIGATGAAAPANARLGGCLAINAEPAAVTNGQMTAADCGLSGKTIVLIGANKENKVSGTTASAMTGTSSTQVIAGVASNKLYITHVDCNNSSATTGTLVQIEDGSGGTVKATLAAGPSFGGQASTDDSVLFSTTAGNGLYAQNVTTGASVFCNANGYSGS